MKATIVKASSLKEYLSSEHCFIMENMSSEGVSIARARLKAGVTTAAHHLKGVDEIYIITGGHGRVYVEGLDPSDVCKGDVVTIPAGASQRITNVGKNDLVFYCVCVPRFTEKCYVCE